MRWHRAGAGALAAAAIAAPFYASTLAPGAGAGDSAELILAAQSLGVPHPPGYPVWTLLARLAAAVPFGELAARVNALSALLAALAVALFHAIAVRTGLRPFGAAVATVVFGGSVLLWRSAVETEIYSLATATFLLLLWLAFRARSRRTGSSRAEALFGFAAGLAVLVHQTLLFPALFLAAWILASGPRQALASRTVRRRDRAPAWRRAAILCGWGLAGMSLLLVVAIRSAAQPAFSFGIEPGVGGAIDALLRRGYGVLRQNPFRTDLLGGQLAGVAAVVASAVGAACACLAAVGALLAGRERAASSVVALAALTVPAALVALIGFRPDAEHLAQVAPFLTPVVASVSLLAGSGASALARRSPPLLRLIAAPTLAACALATAIAHGGQCDRSGFRLPERYARDLLGGLPPGATLILDGDNETFLAAYGTRVLGLRPDVTLIHRRGYVFGDVYGLRRAPRSRWVEIAHRMDRERIEGGERPVTYATPPADLVAAGFGFVQEGLVYRAIPPPAARAATRPAEGAVAWTPPADWPRSTELLGPDPRRYDYVTRKLAVSYSDAAARALWGAGRLADAFPWFEDAARVGFDFPEARINLATAAAAMGRPELALDELLAARSLAPLDPEPAARLAAFLGAAGRHRDAALWFERAYAIAPNAALAMDAARAWKLAGDRARARYWRSLTG